MPCTPLHTGTAFLATSLAHFDCEGQAIGAYGYGALSDPYSVVVLALTALLTIFIAIFGIRLILGQTIAARDVVGDMLKIGIVLTLATSWPAWRVVGFDLVMNGPGEIARSIGLASGLPGADGSLIARLQNADDGLVAITMYGTGRLTGGIIGGSDLGDSFHGIAIADQSGYGWGRIAFLTGVLVPFAITRIGAGILLALAPVMAGLMLFGGTMGIFVGWLRGLAFVALASLAFSVTAGVEVALIDPWIADVLAQRAANTFTPSAPTELTVLAMAFASIHLGMLALIARIAFQPHWVTARLGSVFADSQTRLPQPKPLVSEANSSRHSRETHSRAQMTADAVAATLRREQAGGLINMHRSAGNGDQARTAGRNMAGPSEVDRQETLGNTFRRARTRSSQASAKRDLRV